MGKKIAVYSAGMISLYLVVRNATGSGKVLSAGANGGAQLVRAFQGR